MIKTSLFQQPDSIHMNAKGAMRHVRLKRLIEVSLYNPSPKWPGGYFRVLKQARIREDRFTAYAEIRYGKFCTF